MCGNLPTPATPELTPCQATTVDRTVWSPYSRDINERSKYAGSWGSEEPKWGEANADGWIVAKGSDPKVGDSRTLRLYGATHKDIANATLTFQAVQGLKFDASTINTISNPAPARWRITASRTPSRTWSRSRPERTARPSL